MRCADRGRRAGATFRPLADVGVLEQGVLEQGPLERGFGAGPPVVSNPRAGDDMSPGGNSDALPLLVVNSFTWPNPPVTFKYEADRNDCGSDLRKNLAALVGYLELDVAVYNARSGSELTDDALADQGLAPGDSVRLMRRSKLAPHAGRSTPPIAPSSAALKRFHDSVYTVHCLEQHPKAPVLLRVLQLSHGVLPLSEAGALPGGAHAAELDEVFAPVPRPGGAADPMAVGSVELLAAAEMHGPAAADGAGTLCALDELFDSFDDWEIPAAQAAGARDQAAEAAPAACDAEATDHGPARVKRRKLGELSIGASSETESNADSTTPSTEEASELSYLADSPRSDRPRDRLAKPADAKKMTTRNAAVP